MSDRSDRSDGRLSDNDMVEVQIELGHKATFRERPTKEGYTHDWKVWVQGVDGVKIETFVEKVVFMLHESFPKPKRGDVYIFYSTLSLYLYLLELARVEEPWSSSLTHDVTS